MFFLFTEVGSLGWTGQVCRRELGTVSRDQVSRCVSRVRFLLPNTEWYFKVNNRGVLFFCQQKACCLFFNGEECFFSVNTK